jgi:hypothetical protein
VHCGNNKFRKGLLWWVHAGTKLQNILYRPASHISAQNPEKKSFLQNFVKIY